MRKPTPGTISRENLIGQIKGRKGFISKKTRTILKEARVSDVLHGSKTKKISRAKALKVVKALKEEGELKTTKRPTQIFESVRKKEKEQHKTELAQKENLSSTKLRKEEEAMIKQQERFRAIRNLEEIEADREAGKDPIEELYHPTSALGKQRDINRIEVEQKGKETEKNGQRQGKGSLKPKGINPQKPDLVDLPNIKGKVEDMDID